MRPLVSVVMPVYNGERYLRAAVDSALTQTYPEIEVIAVDDGSTDDSAALIAGYGRRVQGIRQANKGVSAARNAGIRAARGEWIAFLDQDDWWLPGKIESQVQWFTRQPELALVHTGILQYSEARRDFVDAYDTSRSAELEGSCFSRLLLGNGVFNSSVMVRKEILSRVGALDERMARNTVQDYDLWLRIARQYPLGYIAEKLTVLRLHSEQGTANRPAMLGDELRVLQRHMGNRGLRGNALLRQRVVRLLDELGRAHLESGDAPAARQCFARALLLSCSWRAASLFAASFLPMAVIDWVRHQRRNWLQAAAAP